MRLFSGWVGRLLRPALVSGRWRKNLHEEDTLSATKGRVAREGKGLARVRVRVREQDSTHTESQHRESQTYPAKACSCAPDMRTGWAMTAHSTPSLQGGDVRLPL